MENQKQRWSVTYTKHIQQKRKVYQDGFLELQIPANKVKLFDECEKLLECRILKEEEIVGSGETLTFSGYLVDVGEPEGEIDHKHISDLNSRERAAKIKPNPSLMNRHKFKSPVSSDKKDISEKSKARLNNLSPSRKFIREFKKSELQRYGALRSFPESLDTPNSDVTEWQVLYTTQMTQKAKKYHDGFLRLMNTGSLGRQIMLYDERRQLLDSRFLKKDEIIRSQESISFDAHLVDIGEPEVENNISIDLKDQGKNKASVGKEEVMLKQQTCLEANNSPEKEWHALYTSQITQKAKKYHNGILKLTSCGSYHKKVALLDEAKTILGSRFLSSSEDVRSGKTFVMTNYLVEVGEPCGQKETSNNAGSKKDAGIDSNMSTIGRIFKKNACSAKSSDSSSTSTAYGTKTSSFAPTNKSLRDTHQILSILQKPITQNSVVGCTDNNMNAPVFSAKKILVPDAEADCGGVCQLPRISSPNDGPTESKNSNESKEFMDREKYDDLMPCKGGQFSGDHCKTGNSDQSHADNAKADVKWSGVASDSGFPSSLTTCASIPTDENMKSNENLKNASLIDEFPSFDLGF